MRKKGLCILLALSLLAIPTSIASASTDEEYSENIYTQEQEGESEVISDVEPILRVEQPQSSTNSSRAISKYTYRIDKKSKMQYNLFEPLTTFCAGKCTIAYEKGSVVTKSAEFTLGCTVDLTFVQAEVSDTFGVSSSVEASETVTYDVSSGYKGRIVLRYSQDYHTFNILKILGGATVGTYASSGYTSMYNTYYALQSISLS